MDMDMQNGHGHRLLLDDTIRNKISHAALFGETIRNEILHFFLFHEKCKISQNKVRIASFSYFAK
jgi:hypothetical protein